MSSRRKRVYTYVYKLDVDTAWPLEAIFGEPIDTTCGLFGLCSSRYSASHFVGFAGFSCESAAKACVSTGSNRCVLAYSSAESSDMMTRWQRLLLRMRCKEVAFIEAIATLQLGCDRLPVA